MEMDDEAAAETTADVKDARYRLIRPYVAAATKPSTNAKLPVIARQKPTDEPKAPKKGN